MLEILSSREWAVVIWGAIVIIFLLSKKETRQPFFNVIKIFFGKKLRTLWGIYIFYVLIISFIFSKLPFWNNIFIKDIFVWTIFSGLFYYMNAVSNEADETYIKKVVKDNFKLLVLLEFIISTFTFNILTELIIIPFGTSIVLISYITEKDDEFENIHKIFDSIITIFGCFLIFKTLLIALNEYKNLNVIDTFISFIIPIVYLILSLPLIYIVEIYSKYETLFIRMSFKEGEDKKN